MSNNNRDINPFKKWYLILRAYSFPTSIFPFLLGVILACKSRKPVAWELLVPAFLVAECFHAGTNLLNDYYDYIRGVDKHGKKHSSWALTEGWLSEGAAYRVSIGLYLAGFIFGIPIIMARGPWIAIVGIAGALGGFFYTAPPLSYKYRGWGEISCFAFLGPVLTLASVYSLTGSIPASVWIYSPPFGLLVAAMLYGNNLRDRETDVAKGMKTIAGRLSYRTARWGYILIGGAAFAWAPGLILAGKLSLLSLVTFATLPIFFENCRVALIRDEKGLRHIDMDTAKMYLIFGPLYFLALIYSG